MMTEWERRDIETLCFIIEHYVEQYAELSEELGEALIGLDNMEKRLSFYRRLSQLKLVEKKD